MAAEMIAVGVVKQPAEVVLRDAPLADVRDRNR